jgi:tetratricopeptide (TPR) repeat protein
VQAAVLAELSAIAFNGNDAATGTGYADRARKLIEAMPAADPAVHASVDRVAGEALLRGGDPTAAERVFRAGLARIAEELAQPLPRRSARIAAAQLENGLGVSLYMLIQHADAAAAFERSLQLQSGLYGADSAQAGVQAYNLALVQVAAAQFDRAYSNIERSLAIHRARMSADDPRLAMVLSTKADILDQLDRTDEAIAITTEALRISERAYGVDAEQLVDPLETLGELHFMRGEFDLAEAFLLRGIGIARRAGGPRERFVLARSLGTMSMYRKRYSDAVRWFEEALAAGVERTSGQGAVPQMAVAMLAWARGLDGDTDAALAQLEQSRIGFAALPQPDPTDELVRRYYTGEVALRGARTELAIENLREALRLAAENPPYDTSTFAAQSRIALGLALWADPDARPEARGLIEEGIASMQRKSMGFHPLVASGREALAASP